MEQQPLSLAAQSSTLAEGSVLPTGISDIHSPPSDLIPINPQISTPTHSLTPNSVPIPSSTSAVDLLLSLSAPTPLPTSIMGFAKPTVYNPHQSLCTLSLPSTSQSYSKSLYPISIPLESHYKQQQQEQQQLRIGGMAASAPSHRVDPETPNIQYSTPFICQRAWENSPLSRLSVYLLKTYENIKTLNDNEIKRKRSLSTDYDPPKRNKVSTGNNGFDDRMMTILCVREKFGWVDFKSSAILEKALLVKLFDYYCT
ncbi:hypothetical protein BASA61_008598 [Batrachochytrium salamandrivorans]|nr:hypothetical protein BASA61_008598 [Batrachochytrium salamandrivorans]